LFAELSATIPLRPLSAFGWALGVSLGASLGKLLGTALGFSLGLLLGVLIGKILDCDHETSSLPSPLSTAGTVDGITVVSTDDVVDGLYSIGFCAGRGRKLSAVRKRSSTDKFGFSACVKLDNAFIADCASFARLPVAHPQRILKSNELYTSKHASFEIKPLIPANAITLQSTSMYDDVNSFENGK
jgi:hypothetical protein